MNAQQQTGQESSFINMAFFAVIAAGLLLFAVYHVAVTMFFPYPLTYTEGVVAAGIERYVAAAETLYPPISEHPPWLHTPYPPLFYLLSSLVNRGGVPPLQAGRLVSLAAFLAAATALALLAQQHGVKRQYALLATLLFICSPIVLRLSAVAQVDMTGLALALWALLVFRRGGLVSVCMAGILCAGAMLAKPLFIAAPLACFISACLSGKRVAAVFSVALAAGVVAILGVTGIFRNPIGFLFHLVYFNRLPLSAVAAFEISARVIARHILPAVCFMLFASTPVSGTGLLRKAGLAALIALPLTAKTGADGHYLLELIALASFSTAVVLSRIKRPFSNIAAWCLTVQLLLFIPLNPAPVFTRTYGQELIEAGSAALTPRAADREVGDAVSAVIKGTDGPVLCQDIGYLVTAGKPITLQPYQFARQQCTGRWNDAQLVELLATGYFELIIIKFDAFAGDESEYFSPAAIRAMRENYSLLRHIGPYYLLERE